jgi:hypothetical protein
VNRFSGQGRTGLAAIAIVFLASACAPEQEAPPVDPSLYTRQGADSVRAPILPVAPPSAFADITAEAGIDFVHHTGAFGEKWMPESMGSGCVVFDYDGDDRLDLLFVNGSPWPGRGRRGNAATPRLYRNAGDGRFADVTDASGLDISLYGMGGAAGDFDADGDVDLFLTAVGNNRLLENRGGRFEDVTAEAGVGGARWTSSEGTTHPEWSTSAAWVDVDGDGWIDLFVCNYVRWSPETDLFTTIDGSTKSYATPEPYEGSTCRLYRNRGDGTFGDITVSSGVFNPKGKSLGVAVADFNSDGHADLVVTNDTQPNFLYKNRGDGTFKETGLSAGIAYDESGRARAGMGVDVGSLDDDGAPSIAIGNFSREAVSLYRQSWEDFFIDEAGRRRLAGETLLRLTFGLLFVDADLDGYLDLVLSNGHLEPEIGRVRREIAYAQRPQLFRNTRERSFLDVSDMSGGGFDQAIVGRGLAHGDIDSDGDSDLVLTANGGRPLVLRNDGPVGNAVRVRLKGSAPNRQALGATVVATHGERSQWAMMRTGSSYLSQSETTLTFGLGRTTQLDRLAIRWPGGETEELERLEAGATYTVEEGKGVVEREAFRRE